MFYDNYVQITSVQAKVVNYTYDTYLKIYI